MNKSTFFVPKYAMLQLNKYSYRTRFVEWRQSGRERGFPNFNGEPKFYESASPWSQIKLIYQIA
jgi:hypothetical protein